jgi:hypothetical protein
MYIPGYHLESAKATSIFFFSSKIAPPFNEPLPINSAVYIVTVYFDCQIQGNAV